VGKHQSQERLCDPLFLRGVCVARQNDSVNPAINNLNFCMPSVPFVGSTGAFKGTYPGNKRFA